MTPPSVPFPRPLQVGTPAGQDVIAKLRPPNERVGVAIPIKERLFDKTNFGGVADCWEWTACRCKQGYGRIGLNGKVVKAHRAIYEILVGPIPKGLVIDHLCRNRSCMNPSHMEPVTAAENYRRGKKGILATGLCKKGHPLVRGSSQSICQICHKERNKAYRIRLKENGVVRVRTPEQKERNNESNRNRYARLKGSGTLPLRVYNYTPEQKERKKEQARARRLRQRGDV